MLRAFLTRHHDTAGNNSGVHTGVQTPNVAHTPKREQHVATAQNTAKTTAHASRNQATSDASSDSKFERALKRMRANVTYFYNPYG
jgi:hypothetical protein